MRIGIVIGLHGGAGNAPTWAQIRDQVLASEQAGFDLAVVEDALSYRDDDGVIGYWESVSIAGAMCAVTSTIAIGHSVINAPYRSAGLTAKIAETLDEVSGGRFFLGIGLGNTLDYEEFGVPADHRYSRFAETIRIIHSLLRTGAADIEGLYQSAHGAELIPRGPRSHGPPIVIAARGPKMMQLAARYADGWNWWTSGAPELVELRGILDELDQQCAAAGRNGDPLQRSLDLYSLDPLGTGVGGDGCITGPPDEIARELIQLGAVGFDEVRCNIVGSVEDRTVAIEALAPAVQIVHESADARSLPTD
jgi:alkanesulfonate monooxygenase SsuD/methylene tetrahydromethanopterin reductase-like flavin-dependent oxidoreductase (luciferase family)